MAAVSIDAFILYNPQETAIEKIVNELSSRNIRTYFNRRDNVVGEEWEKMEGERLRSAEAVVVFLGDSGWGPNQKGLAERAQSLQKRILPVLIGQPPDNAFDEAGGLFRRRVYLDLRELDSASLTKLADEIRRQQAPPVEQFDRIISLVVDGNEEERADVLTHIQHSKSIDRSAFAARLRTEIEDRFSPGTRSSFGLADREPMKIPSIRSWLLSCLVWADAESPASRDVILKHLRENFEPDRNVRFWSLAGVYQSKASYSDSAAQTCLSDSSPEVSALARAIQSPQKTEIVGAFRSMLSSDKFETAWQVLRLLRIVPIPDLASDVCAQLDRSADGTALAYDVLYALSEPVMAKEAVAVLSDRPGVDGVVTRVIAQARGANHNAARSFAGLLAAFDAAAVDRALANAERQVGLRDTAQILRSYVRYYRGVTADELSVAGYASDTINVANDDLDIREDVQTLTAVMLAKEVTPPLAIGLFGDWGTGKTFFMKSMRAAAEHLAKHAKASTGQTFCSNIVSIEFNAWHYADTSLWASLVSYILDQLAAYVAPKPTAEEQQAVLLGELGSAKAVLNETEAEKNRMQELIAKRQTDLQQLQLERQQKEVQLRDLQLSDLRTLLASDDTLQKELKDSLEQIGAPAALSSISDLSRVVSDAYSLGGRAAALFVALVNLKNRTAVVTIIALLMTIPAIAALFYQHGIGNGLVVVSTVISEFVVVVGGAATFLRKALDQLRVNFARVESAKGQVDALIAAKRKQPTQEEVNLEQEIALLRAREQEAASRLAAATTRSDRVRRSD